MSQVLSRWAQRTADVLVADDGSHDPRAVTASAIGVCLRQAAWRLGGVPFTDEETRHPTAKLGKAIHREVTEGLAAQYGVAPEEIDDDHGFENDEVMIERPAAYAYRGHVFGGRLDGYEKRGNGCTGSGELIDFKSCGDFAWARAKAKVIPYGHIMQALHYGSSVEARGFEVTSIRWVYINRASGEIDELAVTWNGPEMRQALHGRLDEIIGAYVAAANGAEDTVERQGEGLNPKGFSECNSCPFRSRCWGKGDDWEAIGPEHEQAGRIAAVAQSYAEAREAEKAAAGRKARAGAQLRHAEAKGRFGAWNVDATGRALQVRAATGSAPD